MEQWLFADTAENGLEAQRLLPALRNFNPNTASYDSLVAKGVRPQLARNIVRYRRGGGVFGTKRDFQRLYALKEGEYKMLEPYLEVAEKPPTQPEEKYAQKAEPKRKLTRSEQTIDVNCCTAADLQQISGIGEVLSHRIIRYRNALGGFISVDQLHEVYGLDSLVILRSSKRLDFNKCEVKLLRINSLPTDSLVRHPYIDWKMAQRLVRYRVQHGAYLQPTDLFQVHGIEPEQIDRILPYLYLK